MHNADRPAKALADKSLARYKQSALAVLGAKKAVEVHQAVELLSDALSAVVAAQGFIPFATIEKVAHAMDNAARALPVVTIMERAKIFLSLAADREKYEATEQVPWPSEQLLLAKVLQETGSHLAIAIEALGVWSGMFNEPQIALKSGPYSIHEARAAIRELIAPTEKMLQETGDALSRSATIGINNQDNREQWNRDQQKTRRATDQRYQAMAQEIWSQDPDLPKSKVAQRIVNKLADDVSPPSVHTVRARIQKTSADLDEAPRRINRSS